MFSFGTYLTGLFHPTFIKRLLEPTFRAYSICKATIWGPREKICLRGFANKKDAYQPAHPHSLISPFIIGFLENII